MVLRSVVKSLVSQVSEKSHEKAIKILTSSITLCFSANDKVMRAGEAMEAGLRECCR